MKKNKILGLSMVLFVLFSSYGNSDTKINESFANTYDNIISESVDDDCDTWLKNYERFVDKYIVVIKKYKANPSDASVMTEYSQLASEAARWAGKTPDCSDAKHVQKMAEIAAKLSKAVSSM